MPPCVRHCHPDCCDHPDEFLPGPFSAEQAAKRPSSASFPSGARQRICTDENVALAEAQLMPVLIVQYNRLHLVPDHLVVPGSLTTGCPRCGFLAHLESRRVLSYLFGNTIDFSASHTA